MLPLSCKGCGNPLYFFDCLDYGCCSQCGRDHDSDREEDEDKEVKHE